MIGAARGVQRARHPRDSERPLVGTRYSCSGACRVRRAVAAARRYEDLRYGSRCHEGIAPADIPRRIFEEFYSSGRPVESRGAGWNLRVTWRRSGVRRDADQGEGVKS
jgi:hypothetical protein